MPHRMRLSLPCLLAIVSFYSCTNDEPIPNPVIDVISLEVDPGFVNDHKNIWVVVTAKDRNLDFDTLKGTAPIVLRTDQVTADDSVDVTIIRQGTLGTNTYYLIATYAKLKAGTRLTLKTPPAPEATQHPPNSFSGIVTGIPMGSHDATMSSSLGYVSTYSISGNYLFSGNTFSAGSTFNLSVRSNDGSVRHKIFEGIKGGDVLNVTWSELQKYPQETMFEIPPNGHQTDLEVYAFEKTTNAWRYGHIMMIHNWSDSHERMIAGYFDNSARYYTRAYTRFATYSASYQKRGMPPPTTISFPDQAKFTVVEADLNNFKATTTVPITYRITLHADYTDKFQLVWQVFSPTLSNTITELPPELLALEPRLAKSGKRFTNETIFVTGPETYLQGVARNLGEFGEYEWMAITK